MSKHTIECKYCGVCDKGCVRPGKGPHAYELYCGHCAKHSKWLSKYDVDEFTDDEILTKYHALAELLAELSFKAPRSHYIAEEKEFARICDLVQQRGIVT